MSKNEKILREYISLLIGEASYKSTAYAGLRDWNPKGRGPVQTEADGDKVETRKHKGKTYTASAGSLAALKKHKMDVSKAVESGDFDWADEPYAAAQAAYIVATGKTTGDE